MEIAIFPLGNPLFPAGKLALRIFEQRYVDMTKACIRDEQPFGVALIRAGFEVGQPAIPHDLGCLARIREWEVPSPGLFNLHTVGEGRFRILRRWTQADGLIRAEVECLTPPTSTPVPERHSALPKLLDKLMEEVGAQYFPTPVRLHDAAWVGFRLAELMPVTPERKQALLALDDPLAVLDQVERWLVELQEPETD